jgi:hypothetical protein
MKKLTRDYKHTIIERLKSDKDFAEALVIELSNEDFDSFIEQCNKDNISPTELIKAYKEIRNNWS